MFMMTGLTVELEAKYDSTLPIPVKTVTKGQISLAPSHSNTCSFTIRCRYTQ
jgi:hypothetical protein